MTGFGRSARGAITSARRQDDDTVSATWHAVRAMAARGEPSPQGLPNQAPTIGIAPPVISPLGAETRVNTFTTSNQAYPAIAALSGGGYVVVWQSIQINGTNEIYAQRYNASGVAQGAEFRVNSFTTSSQQLPTVTGLTGGGFVVAWDSYEQDGNSTGVYAQRYDALGVAQGIEFRVNSFTSGGQFLPAVAALTGGGFVVTWTSNGQEDGDGTYAQRYDALGVAQGAEFRVNSTITGNQFDPVIVALTGGGFVIVWLGHGAGNVLGIYAQRYDAAGTALGPEFRINTAMYSPSIAALADGGFVVVWNSTTTGFDSDVYAQRYDATGAAQGAEFRVHTFTGGSRGEASVAALGGGGFIVTWTSGGQDGSGSGVYARGFTDAGVALGFEFLVNTHVTDNQQEPAVAVLANGDIAMAWQSNLQDGSGQGIYSQRYAAGVFQGIEGSATNLKDYITVADADAGAGAMTLTLSVNYGIITATPGSSGAVITGSGTSSVTITGTLASIRNLLDPPGSGTVTHLANTDNPPASATLTATINDNGSSGDGGPRTDVATATILITPVNDAPSGFSVSRSLTVGSSRVFSTGDFPFADAEGHALHSVTIVTLPNQGVIRLNGSPIPAGTVVSAGGITAGLLTFTPNPGGSGQGYASFTFQVRDNGGTAAAGAQDTDQSPNVLSLNVVQGTVLLYDPGHTLAGNFITIQDALEAAPTGYSLEVTAAGTYTTSVSYNVSGLTVLFANGAVQNTTWFSFGGLGITITAGDGNDSITGSAGADTIRGGGGNDTVNGSGGNDTLVGGTGVDVMVGGTGNDTMFVDNAGDRALENAGEGTDVVYASVSYALELGSSIETLSTSDQNGTAGISLVGNNLAQIIFGNAGANVLTGGGGADTLLGLGGNDTLAGNASAAITMQGGTGDDWYYVNNPGDSVIEFAGEGNDRIFSSVNYVLSAGRAIESLETGSQAGTAALFLTGNALGQTIFGNAGANNLTGGGGVDYILGFGGNDFLFGNADAASTLQGGSGDDWYYILLTGDSLVEFAGEGNDRILTSTSYTLSAGQEVETLGAADQQGAGAINLGGNDFGQVILGNNGVNILSGGGGSDDLAGLNGNDILLGGEGADFLNGGLGADVLNGGGGADLFVFADALGGPNIDGVQDFLTGQDRLLLENAVYAGLSTGILSAGAFVTGTAAADANDRIIYDSATGALYFDADGTGAAAAIRFATLAAGTSLAASDIVVI